jgi:hypothetical protein
MKYKFDSAVSFAKTLRVGGKRPGTCHPTG